jgi:glyoxylase-like metal-dependent hydrolase (beta-lactamase superfamily II)
VDTLSLPVAPSVACVRDTCNVYVLRAGREAVLVDFGSGAVLDQLPELGVDRVTDVLVTHAHRDQVQGLARAAEAGIRIWVPPYEEHLVARVDEHWQQREVENDYDLRQNRFSLREQVAIAGTVDEYRTRTYGAFDVFALPTPGHTIGSVSYLVEVDGRELAFTGDLLYADGKVWSLAATQWSYSGVEGWGATIVSCAVLAGRGPDALLPSHGEPVEEPAPALESLAERLQELIDLRFEGSWDVREIAQNPWKAVRPETPHLLRNRSSFANSYALVSEEDGSAVLIDFGYDVMTGIVPATVRGARRPLLWTLDALRRDHGIERVAAVLVTHFHDDHVAGLNLIREVHGTEVWAPANVAPVLEEPGKHDLPCLWFDPIPVDRVLELDASVAWHEYEIATHALPGHTRYAAAFAFEVDGRRVLATGDQHAFEGGRAIPNYQYRNRFAIDDFAETAELYRRLRPDLIVSGHWPVREVDEALLDRLLAEGRRVAELHRALLPDDVDLGPEGFAARIEPYRTTARSGELLALEVVLRNPLGEPVTAEVRLVVPDGWEGAEASVELASGGEGRVAIEVRAGAPARRARLAADVTFGTLRLGEQAEALVDVE